jgi:hypothetical protein
MRACVTVCITLTPLCGKILPGFARAECFCCFLAFRDHNPFTDFVIPSEVS